MSAGYQTRKIRKILPCSKQPCLAINRTIIVKFMLRSSVYFKAQDLIQKYPAVPDFCVKLYIESNDFLSIRTERITGVDSERQYSVNSCLLKKTIPDK